MTDFEITRINKPHHLRAHEHITHIGNLAGDWRLTRESAIARITVEASASTLLISRPDVDSVVPLPNGVHTDLETKR